MNRGQTLNTLLVSLLVGCGTVCGPESFTIFRWFVGESPTKTKRLTEDIHIDGNASWCLWAFSDGLPTKSLSAWHRDRCITYVQASLSVSVFPYLAIRCHESFPYGASPEGRNYLLVVQAYCLEIRTVNLRSVFPTRPFDTCPVAKVNPHLGMSSSGHKGFRENLHTLSG